MSVMEKRGYLCTKHIPMNDSDVDEASGSNENT